MIDIHAINAQLVEQDEALRRRLNQVTLEAPLDPAMRALATVLVEGLTAIHERQGNLITLMLQTNV